MMQEEKNFRGVIPGISLTEEPGTRPWERPPEMEDPDEVIQFYLERFSQPEALKKTMVLLDNDFPLRALVEGMLTSGVSRGLHTIDMSMIVGPVIHEFLKGEADSLGVEYDEGLVDKDALEKEEKMYSKLALRKRLEKLKQNKQLPENKEMSEEIFEEEMVEEEPMVEEQPKGLMSRRAS